MHKYISILIIPLIFTFTFDHYVIKNKNTNIKENILNVHKSFDVQFSSTNINNFYSEKIIQKSEEENIVKLKPKIKTQFKELKQTYNLTNKFDINNKFQLTSPDWKNNFTNKKIKFIETVLPLIALENNKNLLERKKLLKIKDFLILEKTLNKNNLRYLNNISKKYKISFVNKHKIDLLNELLLTVNIIPNSIVLAQAANESGWGTSRFAKEYNALFGQYTYDENNGVVPFQREEGKKHLIKNFTSINKSVESYFININSHYAYKKFRELRSQITDFNNDFNIRILTNALDVYAEDKSYVDTINKIIDSNNLNQFDLYIKEFINS
mgnify:CR=1 FL=1